MISYQPRHKREPSREPLHRARPVRRAEPPAQPATDVRVKLGPLDGILLSLVVGLTLFGLLMVFSASFYSVQEAGASPWSRMFKQGLIAAGGLVAMLVLARLDYRKLMNPVIVGSFLGFSLLLLLLVLFVGEEINYSRRWFKIEIPHLVSTTYQPAEQAKLSLVLFMAASISRKGNITNFWKGVLPNLLVMGAMCLLVMRQPNLSTTVSIAAITMMILLLGGAKISMLTLLTVVGAAVIYYLARSEEYRYERLISFRNPFDPDLRQDESYQLVQSLLALGAGGLFGVGPGMSRQKFLFLTYADSDFIFAIIAEELGLLGCVVLLVAYFAVIARGVRIALQCPDRFGSLLAAGTTGMLAIQVILNVAVVTGSVPTTGLPLPFISSGGSSLLAFMAGMGMLLSVSRSLPQRKPSRLLEHPPDK